MERFRTRKPWSFIGEGGKVLALVSALTFGAALETSGHINNPNKRRTEQLADLETQKRELEAQQAQGIDVSEQLAALEKQIDGVNYMLHGDTATSTPMISEAPSETLRVPENI